MAPPDRADHGTWVSLTHLGEEGTSSSPRQTEILRHTKDLTEKKWNKGRIIVREGSGTSR